MQCEINELRNQVRTLKRMVFGLCAVVAAGFLVAATGMQSVPDVIRAKKFEVVNDAGKVLVGMDSVLHQGVLYGFVTTLNGKGRALVKLGVTTDGEGAVETRNGKGQALVQLSADTDGNGAVETQDGKGQVTSVTP